MIELTPPFKKLLAVAIDDTANTFFIAGVARF